VGAPAAGLRDERFHPGTQVRRKTIQQNVPATQDKPAFFAAALWAVHPIATESVTNVAGRADLLATMSILAELVVVLFDLGKA
jgi:hypothetical protein